jgi:serine/threonine protein kinase/Flp pilus assembly protein TadD
MGEVYLAEDTRLGRMVALKFLPASYQYDADRRLRFLTEARAASALRSPHIAAIYDIGEHDGAEFIVMEYVEGETLARRLERGPLSVTEAMDVATQMADALDEAYLRGIVHRDIKSANLVVTVRGFVKILDFGLAKHSAWRMGGDEPDRTLSLGKETVAGSLVGTIAYMSPEQALGKSVDHRSDLFSIGVVTYEMLAGRLPFEGNSPTEIIDRILHHQPAALARFNYAVPQEMERIVRKTLEKDPEFRYQTARELYIDLRNLRRLLDSADRSNEHQATRSLPGSAPLAEPQPANAVAVMTFKNITGEPKDDWIGSGIAETVTGDLKNVRGLSVIGRERIFEALKNLGSGELQELDEKFAIEIGRRLGAAWTIGGGYQRIGDMIRITARLTEVRTGALAGTLKIDGKISEIFDLQDRIVFELSKGLNLQLAQAEMSEIGRNETQSVEAYECFSRGLINLRTGSRDSLDRAIHLFEKAIELDPAYAMAWAALGAAYDLKGSFLSILELSYKAIELERKAIALDPKLSKAYQWLGGAYTSIGHYDEAIEAIKQAVKLDPTNAGAHSSLARAYWVGKGMVDEGITELEHAVAINPDAGWAYLQLSLLHTIRRNYERAESLSRRAIKLQEEFTSEREGLQIIGAHTRLGYVYYCQGRYDDAIAEYNRELEIMSSSDHALRDRSLIELSQKLGAACLKKGDREQADRYFKSAVKHFEERMARGADDPSTKYYIACLYSLTGDADRAVKYFEETLSQLRALNVLRSRTDPDLENMRNHPRYREIVGVA